LPDPRPPSPDVCEVRRSWGCSKLGPSLWPAILPGSDHRLPSLTRGLASPFHTPDPWSSDLTCPAPCTQTPLSTIDVQMAASHRRGAAQRVRGFQCAGVLQLASGSLFTVSHEGAVASSATSAPPNAGLDTAPRPQPAQLHGAGACSVGVRSKGSLTPLLGVSQCGLHAHS
jgi:hypothetical protein